MKKDIRIIALDLDGTLLDSNKNISERNYQALKKAAEQGVEIVPTTGRFYGMLPKVVKDLPFVNYVITVNGASVYDVREKKNIAEANIPLDTALKLMEYMDGFDCIYDCYMDNGAYMTGNQWDRIDEFDLDVHYHKMWKEMRVQVDDLKSFLKKQGKGIQKTQCLVKDLSLKEKILKEAPELFPQCLATSSLKINVEFNDLHASKGQALISLAEHLGCTAENVMSFGDGLNDLSMIKAAGMGIAMANSCKEVLEASNDTVSDNDHDGVAEGIERYCF